MTAPPWARPAAHPLPDREALRVGLEDKTSHRVGPNAMVGRVQASGRGSQPKHRAAPRWQVEPALWQNHLARPVVLLAAGALGGAVPGGAAAGVGLLHAHDEELEHVPGESETCVRPPGIY